MNQFFLKSTTIVFIVFFNPLIGMILTKSQYEAKERIQKKFDEKKVVKNRYIIKDCLQNNSMTVVELRIFRGVCKQFTNDTLRVIYQSYHIDEKYIAPVCVFLDCVHKNKFQEVKWFLQNKLGRSLHFSRGCGEFTYAHLVPHRIVENNEDKEKMVALLNGYNYETKYYTEEIHIELCIAACLGDSEKFDEEFQKIKGDYENYEQFIADSWYIPEGWYGEFPNTIPLVIWAATKNYDVDFIKKLSNYKSYKECIERNGYKFLKSIFLGYPHEFCDGSMLKQLVLTRNHINGVKKIIAHGCFENDERTETIDFLDSIIKHKQINKLLCEQLENIKQAILNENEKIIKKLPDKIDIFIQQIKNIAQKIEKNQTQLLTYGILVCVGTSSVFFLLTAFLLLNRALLRWLYRVYFVCF